ncbi:MAG TPA: IS481 family transposase [Pyrinomonadaceae bacterium]|nr:IS481 family transposase [Pyrinomonadaceae bacterium]
MPWRTKSVMDQRVEFVLRAKEGEESMAGLCRDYGISRPTGYLWLHRYQEAGSVSGLAEHSRRPVHLARETSAKVAAAVLALRDKTAWGGPKIAKALERDGVRVAPATAQRILKRGGRVVPPQVEKTKLRFAREQCNELAQMDFKGDYSLRRGKCYPLSLLDDCSRYLHGLWPLDSTGGAGVKRSLEPYFREHGVPYSLLMDHGTPWFSTTNQHGLTWVAVWLLKQGVMLRYSGIRHPQTQGKVERFHQTLKRRTKHRGEPTTMAEWQHWAVAFREEYNYERPHEALGQKTPAEVYQAVNLRAYQEQPREWEYSGGSVKRLNPQGQLYYRQQTYFVSEALAAERVRVDELDGKLLVTFRHMTVREIDLRTGTSKALVLAAKKHP